MRRNHQGFTLIELLLGLSIFAVIALSLYSVFAGGIKVSRRAEHVNDVMRQGRMAMQVLADDLAQARAFDFSVLDPERTAFTGDAQTLSVLVGTDEGLAVVRYYLKPLDDVQVFKTLVGATTKKNVDITLTESSADRLEVLIRQEAPLMLTDDGDADDDVFEEVLASSVRSSGLTFSYGSRMAESGNVRWADQWNSPGCPAAVKVSLTFQDVEEDLQEQLRARTFERILYIPTGRLEADDDDGGL